MPLIEIEKNDTIVAKDGKMYRVLSVYKNGDVLFKIDGIDDTEPSPMRRPIFSYDIVKVVRKGLKSAGLVAEELAAKKAAEEAAKGEGK